MTPQYTQQYKGVTIRVATKEDDYHKYCTGFKGGRITIGNEAFETMEDAKRYIDQS